MQPEERCRALQVLGLHVLLRSKQAPAKVRTVAWLWNIG